MSEHDTEEIQNRQLYTAAMLAELVKVPVRAIRRWQRAGLIQPRETVLQLHYFDYEGLATAKQLASWLHQGATVESIQRQIDELRQRLGDDISVSQLPVTADGKKLVLRAGDQFLETNGQLRFGFSNEEQQAENELPATIQFRSPMQKAQDAAIDESSLENMLAQALAAEDNEDLEAAIEWYRSALAAFGPNPDICFQLAELLYRQGDVQGARERYFMTLELEPSLVEARANLGCVLAESGQLELAVAAFQGALAQFADYADVHFHLARALDELGEANRAIEHWQRFLELSPASPWAEEAQSRLGQSSSLLKF